MPCGNNYLSPGIEFCGSSFSCSAEQTIILESCLCNLIPPLKQSNNTISISSSLIHISHHAERCRVSFWSDQTVRRNSSKQQLSLQLMKHRAANTNLSEICLALDFCKSQVDQPRVVAHLRCRSVMFFPPWGVFYFSYTQETGSITADNCVKKLTGNPRGLQINLWYYKPYEIIIIYCFTCCCLTLVIIQFALHEEKLFYSVLKLTNNPLTLCGGYISIIKQPSVKSLRTMITIY